jgi:GTP-binding protein EngB required for normal cell division
LNTSRSINFLEKEEIDFLSIEEKTDLLNRVQAARNEVSVAQMLFTATDEQVGIEASTMLQWHKLVSECWQVAMRWRQSSGFKIEE